MAAPANTAKMCTNFELYLHDVKIDLFEFSVDVGDEFDDSSVQLSAFGDFAYIAKKSVFFSLALKKKSL